jgi:hypothetical protein
MVAKALSAPPLGAEVELIVDWLELKAFLSPFNLAQLDDAVSTREMQVQEAETDIGESDRVDDELRAIIEVEISLRVTALGQAYPFQLSEDGEVLEFSQPDENGFTGPAYPYLLCLILSHTTNSPILNMPPVPEMVRQARKRLFQILATLAAAGHAQGGRFHWDGRARKKKTLSPSLRELRPFLARALPASRRICLSRKVQKMAVSMCWLGSGHPPVLRQSYFTSFKRPVVTIGRASLLGTTIHSFSHAISTRRQTAIRSS